LPPAVTHKKRHPMEPISYDELMSNAGMSGFVAFLEHPSPVQEVHDAERGAGALAGTVGATAAIPQEVTPAVLPPVIVPSRASVSRGRQGRIRKATMAEDGHSLAEQAVYEVLWQAASPVSDLADAERTIRLGYHRLAQMTRLSWVSVKANLRTLERKLAIEVTGSENSATREGKCYLVYSRSSILARRKRAGLEWVRRTRGVELLSHATIALGRPGPQPVD
jgi:hypothetical protein